MLEQPLPSVLPHALHCSEFQAKSFGRFFFSEPKEVPHFDERAPLRPAFGEMIEQPVYSEGSVQFDANCGKEILDSLKWEKFGSRPTAGVIDQVSAHGPSGYSEKMLPTPPIPIPGGNHLYVNLVDEFGRLQSVALALAPHQVVGQTA